MTCPSHTAAALHGRLDPWRRLRAVFSAAGWSLSVVCLGCGTTDEPGAPPIEPQRVATAAETTSSEPSENGPVRAELALAPAQTAPGREVELSVTLQVAPLWEIYPLEAGPTGTPTSLELNLPAGVEAATAWRAPRPDFSTAPDGHAVYAAEVVFTRTLKVTEATAAGDHAIKCRIRLQACNDRQCLAPSTIELSAPLHVE